MHAINGRARIILTQETGRLACLAILALQTALDINTKSNKRGAYDRYQHDILDNCKCPLENI